MAAAVSNAQIMAYLQGMNADTQSKLDKLLEKKVGGMPKLPAPKPVGTKPIPPSERVRFMQPGTYFSSGMNPLTNEPFQSAEEYEAFLKQIPGFKLPRTEKYLTCQEDALIRKWEAAEKKKG